MVLTFSALDQKKPFLSKSGQKNQNCQYKRKFDTKTNLNVRNSMIMFAFSVFDHEYLFGHIWSKNSKLFVESQI